MIRVATTRTAFSRSLLSTTTCLLDFYDAFVPHNGIPPGVREASTALDSCSPDQIVRSQTLRRLAFFVSTRYSRGGEVSDLETAILLSRDALEFCPEGHPDRSLLYYNLASFLLTRFNHSRRMEDLDEAISLHRTALELRPEGHPCRFESLNNLATSLSTRFLNAGRMEDLEEAIILSRAALRLLPEGHANRFTLLSNMASSISVRFRHSGRLAVLEEAITLARTALDLLPVGHSDRFALLSNLATSVSTRFNHEGRTEDLEEAISLRQAALELLPEGHPVRPALLSGLASELSTRFQLKGRTKDLEEAISFTRVSLEFMPESDPQHPILLGSLAGSLVARFNHGGRTKDLEEAISLQRTALDILPVGHSERCAMLNNLATSFLTRFTHLGRLEDLEEAISLHRAAVELVPGGQLNHSAMLSNLADSVLTRSQLKGRMEDLEEAITLSRIALGLLPEGHPHRPAMLSNLALSLSARFNHGGRMEDLEEAISLHHTALELLPAGHTLRSMSLNNVASSILTRYQHKGRREDLEEAITLLHAALELLPEGHADRPKPLNNLAFSLSARFKHSGKTEDLEESITLTRAILEFLPADHPTRPAPLDNLASSLLARYGREKRKEDLEEAISLYRALVELRSEGHPDHSKSLADLAITLYGRFLIERRADDLEESMQYFSRSAVYPLSSFFTRLRAVQSWLTFARREDHRSLPEAYRTGMSLLQRALTIRPTLSAQHKFLSSDSDSQSLALDAASYAIDKDDFPLAIEFLEQGRALLWSQLRGFRTPLDQLSRADKALGERFESCNHRLEALIASSESPTSSLGTDGSFIPAFSASQEQNLVDDMLVQMRLLHEEQEAIISEIRRMPGFENFLRAAPFDAIQQAASEGPVIVLNHSKYRCDALIVLSRENNSCACVPLDENFYTDAVKLHGELLQVRQEFGVASCEYDEILRRVMKVLWDRAVSKVIQKLRQLGVGEESRIWWCPTSVLSAFPFHAAVYSIRRFKKLIDDRATPEAVLEMLQRAQWVHFACHGRLDEEPFNSSLELPGGRLTLLDIARANLPNAEFAVLLACHTAEQGPKYALDEALHLAAAMQFCGFRGVVGTMWQVLDRDGPFLSGVVYRQLMNELEEGEARFKKAAAAVREAALRLRERGDEGLHGERVEIMAERWVNLVHIGA
ncbi:hypothetical protein A7U60_g5211 [Sanghuangporus baumii]|uniref:CHAT domain-containing protein n=1 Tax=Sanghuangporus baumii TaxID=108892 RepID=A0A9Q5HX80_SANBA|nr:hypothetical protein A7U60_g5211 [Sanghuangporus baumii]